MSLSKSNSPASNQSNGRRGDQDKNANAGKGNQAASRHSNGREEKTKQSSRATSLQQRTPDRSADEAVGHNSGGVEAGSSSSRHGSGVGGKRSEKEEGGSRPWVQDPQVGWHIHVAGSWTEYVVESVVGVGRYRIRPESGVETEQVVLKKDIIASSAAPFVRGAS